MQAIKDMLHHTLKIREAEGNPKIPHIYAKLINLGNPQKKEQFPTNGGKCKQNINWNK